MFARYFCGNAAREVPEGYLEELPIIGIGRGQSKRDRERQQRLLASEKRKRLLGARTLKPSKRQRRERRMRAAEARQAARNGAAS